MAASTSALPLKPKSHRGKLIAVLGAEFRWRTLPPANCYTSRSDWFVNGHVRCQEVCLPFLAEWGQLESERFYEVQDTFIGALKGCQTFPENFGCILAANCRALSREQGMVKCWGHSDQAINKYAARNASD
jgi:hypothetical protein